MAHGQTNHTTYHQVTNNSAINHQPLDPNREDDESTFQFVSNAIIQHAASGELGVSQHEVSLSKTNQKCLLQKNVDLYVQENGVADRPNELTQGEVNDLKQKYEQEDDAQSSISSSSSTTGLIIDEQEEEPPASPYASVVGFHKDYKGDVEEEEDEEEGEYEEDNEEKSSTESSTSSDFDEGSPMTKEEEEDDTSSSDSTDYPENNSDESLSTDSFASSSYNRDRLIPVDLGQGKNLCFPKVQQTEEIANAEHVNNNQDSNQSQNDPVAGPISTAATISLNSEELSMNVIDEDSTIASINDHTNETIEDCARFQTSINLSGSKKRSISSDKCDETYISGDIKRCRTSSP
ncbi:unnamed protein product [Rotaria magnacalcarata]|uniref:Uncharacterized protein n=1 Tax=Rotaria magnacalcarata TaxID=392030 RepID=A0A816U5G3_9BILA|nr:unnamed protein product [Rotaria magnacalcarata]